MLIISLLVVTAVAGAVNYWTWKQRRDEEARPPQATSRGRREERQPVLDPVRFLQGHEDGVHAVAFSSDGARLLTGSHDGSARLWETQTGRELKQFIAHDGAVFDACFSADDKRIATAGQDGKVMVWDAGSGELLAILGEDSETPVQAVSFLPDGSVLSAGGDGLLRHWNPDDETELNAFQGHRVGIYALDVSRDGKRAATGSRDGMVVLWDLESGRALWQSAWPAGSAQAFVRGIALSPDGSTVVATAYGRPAQAWDTKTGRPTREITAAGLSGVVTFSSDGRRLFIATQEGTCLWEPDTMNLVLVLTPADRMVHDVALSRDGRWAAVGRGGYHTSGGGWARADDPRVPVWDLQAKPR